MDQNQITSKEFDVIIAGGGTAACVVAARLAESNRDLSILIIEGGKDNYGLDNVLYPALTSEHVFPGSQTSILYLSNASESMNGGSSIVHTGGILGGGSSINVIQYSRALIQDFDSWNMPGWSGQEMKPFLKKLETYHGPGDKEDHGFDGPIHISGGTYRATRVEDDIIPAAEAVGIPETKDLQNLETANACERSLRFVSPDGIRQDTAHRYLHPLLRDGKHPNLHLLLESKVLRVIFDEDKRAVGVEYIPNPELHPQTTATLTRKQTIRAKKLVVLSCGSLGTPAILERSGIGGSEVLKKKASVPMIVDLPGVGSDYQDHPGVPTPYYTYLNPVETLNDFQFGLVDQKDAVSKRDPHLGWNAVDISMKTRPTEAEVEMLGETFKAVWERDYKSKLQKPLILTAISGSFIGDPSEVVPGQYVSVYQYQSYPYSRGSIHITGPELDNKLDFETGFLSDPDGLDLRAHVWWYKKSREIMRRTKFCRGEVAIAHPKFPEGSKAACVEDWLPFKEINEVTDLKYSAEDDKAIEDFVREKVRSSWHSLGTAKMAPRESGGVVDSKLNVYGVTGLKVADLSIVPKNVAANTNNTAIAVGEKGADTILMDLKS